MHRDHPQDRYADRSSDYSNYDYQATPYPAAAKRTRYDDYGYSSEPEYNNPSSRALDRHDRRSVDHSNNRSDSRRHRYDDYDDGYDDYTSSSSDDSSSRRRRKRGERERSNPPLKKAIETAKSHTSTSHTGIGAGLVGAVAGGFFGAEGESEETRTPGRE